MIDRDILTYNALDSAVTMACYDEIIDELKATGYMDTYRLSQNVLPVLFYMSCRGIRVDMDLLEEEKKRVNASILAKEEELKEETGIDLNVQSPKACQAYFYGTLAIKPYTKVAKDKHGHKKTVITTDDKAMARIARGTANRKPVKAARLVQELRGLLKLRGTYLEIEFDKDGRLRCSVNPRGTRFGRLSTSQTIFGTGTNMQNLPEGFKTFLVSDPGCVFYEIDKARAEWIVVAYASGDSGMISVCEQSLDPHTHTAYQMFNVDKEIILEDSKIIGHMSDPAEIKARRDEIFLSRNIGTKDWPRTMSMRQAGKKANHGLNYDETYVMFALSNEIQEAEAKKIIDLYHRGYPGIRRYHEATQSKLRNDRTLYNCFGRKYKFLLPWGKDLFKAAYAFVPQSTVVDLVNEGMAQTFKDNDPCMEHSEILMQVHDSVLNQWHLERSRKDFRKWAQAIHRQAGYLNPTLSYNGRSFAIGSDMKIGTNWGDMVEVPIVDNVNELADRLEDATNEICYI